MKAHNFIDITGQKFGRLTVIRQTTVGKNGKWLCRCECGKGKTAFGNNLKRGMTKSCGCLASEASGARVRTHGRTGTPEYRIWKNMHTRCYNPNNHAYPRYGGRGIVMCERWKDSFENFLADMGERPTSDHSIDRIDNDKGYSLDNCRWATRTEQNRNYSRNRMIEYRGKTQTLQEWSEELGFNYLKVYKRIYTRGWSVERAFEQPTSYSPADIGKVLASQMGQ